MVRQRHPLLTELDGREDHLLDGAAAVAPVGVRVQVTAEGGIQLGAAAGQRLAVLLLRRDEVCRQDAAHGLADDRGARVADSLDLLEGSGLDAFAQLVSEIRVMASMVLRKASTR